MCGIAGLVDPAAPPGEVAGRLSAMLATLAHRGPDDRGEWHDAGSGVALGLCRLAVIDLSPNGHQPMISASGRWIIVMNGEIYNFRRLRAELEPEVRFRGESDTEVALAAIERWGVRGAVERFIGMFAIALWDRHDRQLYLIRDRLGVKPLYWGRAGRAVVFGSELKALVAHPEFSRRIDRDALAGYFRFGYVPESRSIWSGVQKLPPGTILTLAPGGEDASDPELYWSAATVAERGMAEPLSVSDDEALDLVEETLRDAVALRMIADVPLGVFLSGGIDSSTVAAMMQVQSARPVRTFSIGFDDEAYDESVWASEVARRLGTEHVELRATAEEALAVIPRLADLYDEPFADSSQIPTWLVSSLARKHVTVALTGDGGDELFGGYVRHLFAAGRWASIRRIPRLLRLAGAGVASSIPEPLWSRAAGGAAKRSEAVGEVARPAEKLRKAALAMAAGTEDDLWLRLTSLWSEPPLVEKAPVSSGADRSWPGSAAERLMFLDLTRYLPGDLLVKVDRASMGASLEAREPLLDHRLVELAWKLPMSSRIRGSQGKWVLRRILERHLPPELVNRPKMGFAVPLADWLRGPLVEWADELLSPERLRRDGLLDPKPIRDAWREHRSGARNREHALWTVLMFQAWIDRWGGGNR